MNRESRLWLLAAGVVAVVVTGVVLVFGVTFAPSFPNLYDDGGPVIEGTVAYVEYDRGECAYVLDLATGDRDEITCAEWLWLAGWDDSGNLIIDAEPGRIGAEDHAPVEPSELSSNLRARSPDGHATLVYDDGTQPRMLIDVEGPRNYGFRAYGVSSDAAWAWVVDSEDRLLVVAIDGSSGPWLVAEGVGDIAWK